MSEFEWEYTRTARKHYIFDGDFYGNGKRFHQHYYLWEICSTCGLYVSPPGRDGYDLYYKGKKIKHGKTVKELKTFVEQEGGK